MKVKVSDVVRKFFEEKGVHHAFVLSGGMMMHLLDSLSKSKTIRYICNHHEQASAIGAEAYARETGQIGVCYATSGPGATNTITGVAGAWLDSSPLMVITGQSRKDLTVRGTGVPDLRMVGNFEVNIVDIAKPITKYSVFVDDPAQILFHLQKAFYLATSGRPGPVLLDIPLDVQGATVEESTLAQFTPPEVEKLDLRDPISQLVARLKSSKQPLILAGHGIRVAQQTQAFKELAARLGVPVVTTQLANDLLPYDHNLYVGHVGLRGDRAGNFAVQSCDFLLVIGSSLHITTTGYDLKQFAPQAYKVVVDVDEAQLCRNHIDASLQIKSDVASFISNLSHQLVDFNASEKRDWANLCSRWKQSFPISKEPHPTQNDEINTYHLIDVLSDVLEGNETIITDAGSLYYIVGQALRVKGNQRVIVSGGFGAMGYALPAAIGASVAAPSKRIVCITGDGSLQTNVQELATLAYHKLNCLIIVLNNNGYASIRNTQTTFCDGNIAASSESTGVSFPNWEKIAGAYGLNYAKESRFSKIRDFLASVVHAQGPILCEIVIPTIVHMLPAVTSEKLPNGSFRSNRLHEMSPPIASERLQKEGFIVDAVGSDVDQNLSKI